MKIAVAFLRKSKAREALLATFFSQTRFHSRIPAPQLLHRLVQESRDLVLAR